MIAFLGTGLLGTNFVRALRRRGEEVHVWNRSFDKAQALESVGARAFEDAADAVRGATRVHVVVSDDAAVDQVLAQAERGLTRGSIIIDHTTTAPDPTAIRIRDWTAKGFVFQHAPVMMGPQNALDGTGSMLISGPRAQCDALTPALEPMTGKLIYLGEQPTRAAATKLMGNLFLLAVVGGITDMFALGKSLGVPTAEAVALFDWFNPAPPARAAKMAQGEFSNPSWMLAMARKDARLMIESAGAHGTTLDVIPAVAAAMDRWIAAGHANDDWTVISADAVS